ncbi:MAG: NAD(P)/FAD-dependent oxidoreductase [Hyphomicrobiaceae bacterium]
MTAKFDVAVVGGGITGLTAAHHAALEGVSVVHFAGGGVPGGLVANVGELEGFPATGAISALDLALRLGEENGALGVEVVVEDVTRLEANGRGWRLSTGDSGAPVSAKAVVAATGARLRMLDLESARRLVDRGVSQCAWCNGSLHRGQEVVVIGGGDSALQEALHLARYASLVTVVTRGAELRARRALVDRAAANDKIAFRWETDVLDILGDDAVTGIRLRDRAGESEDEIACRGVFVYVGLEANAGWLQELVARDEQGFVVIGPDLATATPGLYAAGALRSGYGGRLTHAVGEATAAGIAAARFSEA